MKKPVKKKAATKPRADKYEKKLKIKGGLEDVINIALSGPPKKK